MIIFYQTVLRYSDNIAGSILLVLMVAKCIEGGFLHSEELHGWGGGGVGGHVLCRTLNV